MGFGSDGLFLIIAVPKAISVFASSKDRELYLAQPETAHLKRLQTSSQMWFFLQKKSRSFQKKSKLKYTVITYIKYFTLSIQGYNRVDPFLQYNSHMLSQLRKSDLVCHTALTHNSH